MRNFFLYHGWLLAYPNRHDFLDMGFGIEARYRRCKPYWRRHLENCLEFQRRFLTDTKQESLAVLGAGRLYDIDVSALCHHYRDIFLYDADPSCFRSWRKVARRFPSVHGRILDLTGCLDIWTAQLETFFRTQASPDQNRLASFLRGLKTAQLPHLSASACLSLNLLSQICIYWRDRVHHLVKKRWGLDTGESGEYQGDLQAALVETLSSLQNQHLTLLSASQATRIVMIFDSAFFYYRCNAADWQKEQAIFIAEPVLPAGYRIIGEQTWLWDIAPQGVEQVDYGTAHEVRAVALERERG